MIFNGIDLSTYFKIKSITGRGVMVNTVTMMDNPVSDGSTFQFKKMPSRKLAIAIDIKDASYSALRDKIDELNGILIVDGPVPITFTDQSDLTYYGIPEASADGGENPFIHSDTLNIVCPDPLKYGAEVDRSFTSDALTFTLEGTYKTYPVFTSTFTVAANQFVITNTKTGKSVTINYNFAINDVLVIDHKMNKITINGTNNMTTYAWDVSEFFALEKGDQSLTTTTGVATTSIKYNPTWA